MELKLNISKKGLATTAEVINEEYTLNYGHVFRGKSAYEQAVDGGYSQGKEEFEAQLGRLNKALHTDEVIDSLDSTDNEYPLAARQGRELNRNKVGYAEYDSQRKAIVFFNDQNKTREIGSVDAAPFIKDGMIASVSINPDTQVLTITFNTDAGKQPIEVNMSTVLNNKVDIVKDAEDYIPLFARDGQLKKSNYRAYDMTANDIQKRSISYDNAENKDYNSLFGESGDKTSHLTEGGWRMRVNGIDMPAAVNLIIEGKEKIFAKFTALHFKDDSNTLPTCILVRYQVVFRFDVDEGKWVFDKKTNDAIDDSHIVDLANLKEGDNLLFFAMRLSQGRAYFQFVTEKNEKIHIEPSLVESPDKNYFYWSANIDGVEYSQKIVVGSFYIITSIGEIVKKKLDNISADLLTPTTYAELRTLKEEGKLVAGMMYRITDYMTATSQTNTRSANHRFDIIVTALDNRTLSEDAMAIQHEGDTYFANSNLAAWRLRYRFENDSAEFGWARKEDATELAKWSSQWGILDTADINGSKGYIEKVIDGVTKYLYAPANRGSFLEQFNFYKRDITGSITDYNELVFESDNEPYVGGEDYDGDGEYDDTWEEWYEVSEIVVKTASGDIVTTLRNDGSSSFYDERDSYNDYPIYFDAHPQFVDGKYRYTPTDIDSWWYGFVGGSIDSYTDVPYSGDYSDLYYCFDAPLAMSEAQPTPQVCSEQGVLYLSNDWSDTISYSPFVSGGRGVIYRMIDEWNNSLPYDFKNIQHLYEGVWYYTFNSVNGTDLSIPKDMVYGNTYTKLVSDVSANKHFPLKMPRLIHSTTSTLSNAFTGNYIDVEVRDVLFVISMHSVSWVGGYITGKAVSSCFVNKFVMSGNAKMLNVYITGGIDTLYMDVQIRGSRIVLPENNAIPVTKPSSLRLLRTTPTGSWQYIDIDMGTVLSYGHSLEINVGFIRGCKFVGYGKFASDGFFADSSFNLTTDIELLKPANGSTMSTTNLLSNVHLDALNWENTSKETIVLSDKLHNGSKYIRPFEWRVTKNTSGEVKQWCPADLV